MAKQRDKMIKRVGRGAGEERRGEERRGREGFMKYHFDIYKSCSRAHTQAPQKTDA